MRIVRSDRLAKEMARKLSRLIVTFPSDEALRQVTIVNVDMSKAAGAARIGVTTLGSTISPRVVKSLNKLSHLFRKKLYQEINSKFIPKLSFYKDETIEKGARILDILNQLEKEKTVELNDNYKNIS